MRSLFGVWAFHCAAMLAVPPDVIGQGLPAGLTIVVDLVVEDTKGRPVSDLMAGDFVVAQDRVRQKIASLKAKGQPGQYELSYVPASGKPGPVIVQMLRLGTRVRGVDGPGIKPRVVLPVSTLATELLQILETRPDADDFPSRVSALRFESARDGVHYTLALEVPLGGLATPEAPSRQGDRLQIYARLSDAQGRIVRQFETERSLASSSAGRTAVQRMVWTGQVHLPRGTYLLQTVTRHPETGRASVRQASFDAPDPMTGLGLSSVALLHPVDSLTVRDQGRETDDPFLLAGEPLMPTLELHTSAAPGVKVEFFTIVYPDLSNPEPVTLTLEVVREGNVVATVPLALPSADDRGEIRYAGGMATRTLAPADYRLRLVAQQGGSRTSEETAFSVRADSDAAPVRIAASAPTATPPAEPPAPPEVAQAKLLIIQQDYSKAIAMLKKIDATTGAARADVALLLAAAYNRVGAHKDAEAAARRAIDLAKGMPTLAEAYLVLGRILAASESKPVRKDSEKLRAAEEAFRQSLSRGDARNEAASLSLAEALLRLERDAEARELLTAVQGRKDASQEGAARARQLLGSPRCATEPCLPALSFVTSDGRLGTSDDLRGKAVLVSFWATWCKPCVEAVPELRRLSAKYENEPFTIVGINLDGDPSVAQSFARANQMSWPQAVEDGSPGLGAAAAQGIPLEILYDHEGVLIGKSRGWGSNTGRALFAYVQGAVDKAKKARSRITPQGQ